MYYSLSGMLSKSWLTNSVLRTMEGLKLLAGSNVVNQLEYFLRYDKDLKSSLAFYRDQERNKHNLVFMLDPDTGDDMCPSRSCCSHTSGGRYGSSVSSARIRRSFMPTSSA